MRTALGPIAQNGHGAPCEPGGVDIVVSQDFHDSGKTMARTETGLKKCGYATPTPSRKQRTRKVYS